MIVFDQLDAYLGRIRYDDLHFGMMRQLEDLRPLIAGGQYAAYRRANNILLHLFPVLDAAYTKRIETVLLVEGSGIAKLRRFYDSNSPVKDALPVSLVDEVIRQT